MTQLYVGNLSEEGDEKSIRSLFGKYGTVREVLMKNGYAFVEMESPLQAEHVMRVLNGETPHTTTALPAISTGDNATGACYLHKH